LPEDRYQSASDVRDSRECPDLSEDGLEEIGKIPNLTVLSLFKNPQIKDDGIAKLVNLKRLKA
jgi:hypothetical protein